MTTSVAETKWKSVGVIGGLGPRASAHFYKLLIDLSSQQYGAVFDSDYPYIALLSLSSQGMSETGKINDTILLPEVGLALDWFDRMNVNVIAIACNSLYVLYDQLLQRTSGHLINLPEKVATSLVTHSIGDVAILGAQFIKNTRLYDSYFLNRGIRPNYPNLSIQKTIDKWIFNVMQGEFSEQTTASLLEVIETLLQTNDAVLLACSELSVLVDPFSLPENTIDSMRTLAEATLREACASGVNALEFTRRCWRDRPTSGCTRLG